MVVSFILVLIHYHLYRKIISHTVCSLSSILFIIVLCILLPHLPLILAIKLFLFFNHFLFFFIIYAFPSIPFSICPSILYFFTRHSIYSLLLLFFYPFFFSSVFLPCVNTSVPFSCSSTISKFSIVRAQRPPESSIYLRTGGDSLFPLLHIRQILRGARNPHPRTHGVCPFWMVNPHGVFIRSGRFPFHALALLPVLLHAAYYDRSGEK